MASKGKVTLTFAGDSDQLEKAFDKVGSAADGMSKEVGRASKSMSSETGSSFDRIGDAAGDTDTRMMGFRDGITGVEDSLKGLNQLQNGQVAEGLFNTAMGFGDLASSVENLIAPMAKSVAAWVTGNAKMAATTALSVARQIASWVMLGLASLAGAAQVALAWLISMGPIILVIAAVIGLVVIIVKNWDTIKEVIAAGWNWVKNVSAKVWDAIKKIVIGAVKGYVAYRKFQINVVLTIFRTIKSGIGGIVGGLASIITAPFRKGFGAIKGIWNRSIGGKGFSVPDWVPGVGGKSFKIPKLAKGGIVQRRPGGILANVGEGSQNEAVMPLDRLERMFAAPSGAPMVVNVHGSIISERELLAIIRNMLRKGGFGV